MLLKSDKDSKTNWKTSEFELLVPANNKDIAIKAINAGADAVYIGYLKYGARVQAGNSIEDIINLIEYAHRYRVKIYVTLNTIIKDSEFEKIEKLIWHLYTAGADGIIIQDMGILKCNLPPIPLIASTQCNNNSVEKIKFLEKTGFKRVILPREITLEEIKEIRNSTKIELECFVHGALCVSYSGQCYLSYAIGRRSANRGECAQPCRKQYSLKDADGKFIVRNKYLLSLKDLNLSERLEELILSGVTSFKIEGRLKNEVYTVNTTAFYRQAIDKILSNYNLKKSSQGESTYDFEPNLYKSFNRGFTRFNIDNSKKDISTYNYSKSLGEYIGIVKSVKKDYFKLNTGILNNGDGICFFDDNKNLNGTYINKIDEDTVYPASIKGIKEGIKIYRNYNKKFEGSILNANITRKIPLMMRMKETDDFYVFFLTDEEGNCANYLENKIYEAANNKEKAINTLKIQLSKSGETEFSIEKIDIDIENIPFIRVAKINEIRRILTLRLRKIRRKNYKYEKRYINTQIIKYPAEVLDYRANVFNEKAKIFYEERGVKVIEKALESSDNISNREVMVSKYCIKNQLGLCHKQNPIKRYKEPFFLIDEFNKEYLVEFKCKDCVMKIKTVD